MPFKLVVLAMQIGRQKLMALGRSFV